MDSSKISQTSDEITKGKNYKSVRGRGRKAEKGREITGGRCY